VGRRGTLRLPRRPQEVLRRGVCGLAADVGLSIPGRDQTFRGPAGSGPGTYVPAARAHRNWPALLTVCTSLLRSRLFARTNRAVPAALNRFQHAQLEHPGRPSAEPQATLRWPGYRSTACRTGSPTAKLIKSTLSSPACPTPFLRRFSVRASFPSDGPPRKASSAYASLHRIPAPPDADVFGGASPAIRGSVCRPAPHAPYRFFPGGQSLQRFEARLYACRGPTGSQNPPAFRSATNQAVPTAPKPVARLHAPLFTRLLLAIFATMPLSATKRTMLRPVYRKSPMLLPLP